MKKVILVESPSKVKTLKKFLNDFIIGSTIGHIKDLPQKKIGVEIDKNNNIIISYEPMKGKEKVITEIKKLVKDADIVYLASDPDREGEIIALHAKEVVESVKNKKEVVIKRITYNEITKTAVTEALKNARDIDYDLINAQQARRILDRWVGYKVSPVLCRKISKGLSAGRVQSVALKLICLRENEIKDFNIEEYWSIHGTFKIEKNEIYADLIKIKNKKFESCTKDEIENIFNKISIDKNWIISEIKDSKKKRNPLAPFITSTLQQAAYNTLGFNVQQTMILAQKLYEGITIDGSQQALITYMRTDSTRIADEALKGVRNFISKDYGDKYLPKEANIYTKKNIQDAHEAIRPIDISIKPKDIMNHVEKDLYKLYELIWNKFVSSQMNPAEYANRQVLFDNEEKDFTFKASGSTLLFDGFLKVFNYKEDEEKEGEEKENKLPLNLEENKSIKMLKKDKKQHFTQPPARYSEATLVKELENKKIGRPSTYVPTLRTIRDRLYTLLDAKRRFVPTDLGILVIKTLEENIPSIINISFTAEMEEKLDLIAQNKETRDNVLINFYKDFEKAVEKFENKKIEKNIENTNIKCQSENCDGMLRMKFGKNGQFLGCEKFPECTFTANFTKDENDEIVVSKVEKKENVVLDKQCPACKKNLILRKGRFGEFVACPGYPECKHIEKEKTKNLCPECNKVHLTKKIWKGQVFWGCESYPTCKFSISGDIIEKNCEKCNSLFLQKRNGKLSCAKKECDYSIEE